MRSKRQVLVRARPKTGCQSGQFGKTTTKLAGRGDCASYADGLHVATAWIHGETTVESLDDDIVRSGRLCPANHRSTSDRSHPPETCFAGNRPLFVQRKRVDRLTPTTRSTSAVLILWSSGANRSGFGAAGIVGRGVRTKVPHGPKRRGSCRGSAPSMLARRLRARDVSFEDICSTDAVHGEMARWSPVGRWPRAWRHHAPATTPGSSDEVVESAAMRLLQAQGL
jgi:hypothetical protein